MVTVHYPADTDKSSISELAEMYAELIQKYYADAEAEKLGVKKVPA